MSESQKDIIENLLKERGITKRELAKVLGIKENSINRTLKNPGIKLSILGTIADFLEVDIIDLLPKKESVHEPETVYQRINPLDAANQLTISNLSDALNRNSKTIENLIRIIAERYTGKEE